MQNASSSQYGVFSEALEAVENDLIPQTYRSKAEKMCDKTNPTFGDVWQHVSKKKKAVGTVWESKELTHVQIAWKGTYFCRATKKITVAHIRGLLLDTLKVCEKG